MPKISILQVNNEVSRFCRYYSPYFIGDFVARRYIFRREITYTADRAILYKQLNELNGVEFYTYYLIGKNCNVSDISESFNDNATSAGVNNGSTVEFLPNTSQLTSTQIASLSNFPMLNIDLLNPVLTSRTISISNQECVNDKAGIGNLSSIPEKYIESVNTSVLGISRSLFSFTGSNNTEWNMFKRLYPYFSDTNNVSKTTADTSQFLYKYKDFISVYRYLVLDNTLTDKEGNFKNDFTESDITNGVTAFDLFTRLITTEDLPRTTPAQQAGYGMNTAIWSSTSSWVHGVARENYSQELLRVSPISPLYDNALIMGIYISEDLEGCNNYIQTGELPDDAYKVKEGDTGLPDDWSQESTQNEDGSDNTSIDNMEQDCINPTKGALTNGMTRYYLMTPQGQSSFIHWFWYDNDDLIDALNNWLTNIYGNLKETILSLTYYPCLTSAIGTSGMQEDIQLGKYDSNIQASRLTALPTKQLLGTIDVSTAYPHFKSFCDYSPYTQFQLYLPFYGVVDIPVNITQNKTINIYYTVDCTSLQLLYMVFAGGALVFQTSLTFGESIPLSLSDAMETMTAKIDLGMKVGSAVVMTAATIGAGAATAGLGAVAGATMGLTATSVAAQAGASMVRTGSSATASLGQATFNAIEQYSESLPTLTGSTNGIMGKWSPLKCALIVNFPIIERADNYGKFVGYPYNQVGQLNNMSGYVQCSNPQIKFTEEPAPLLKEIEELYSIMESGFFIE